MLYDPARHEALHAPPWSEERVRAAIAHVGADTKARFTPERYWPLHPLDADDDEDPSRVTTPLYFGACGVIWALHHLQAVGAVEAGAGLDFDLDALRIANRVWLGDEADAERASFLMGETPIDLLAFGLAPSTELGDRLAELIAGNFDHPARELMWGSPGTLLAALFLYRRSAEPRWAELFRRTAARLWSQLEWSPEHGCHHWTQDLYGRRSTYLDAVHGFVATALPLIRGRDLLGDDTWGAWQRCIVDTVSRTASRSGAHVNWRTQLHSPPGRSGLWMQFCHGAPGFVICLADMPGDELDELLIAAGEATWAAGPLVKGSNLCHGTGGNGYAFLKLFQRTGNVEWLARARAFAMHGIAQLEATEQRYGRLRYSLWTGDLGFAIYLWDCIRGAAAFPTLDVFYAD